MNTFIDTRLQAKLTMTHSNISRLLELVQKISINDFPSDGPATLLSLIVEIATRMEEALGVYASQIKDIDSQDSADRLNVRIWSVAKTIAILAKYIEYIETSTVHVVSWALVSQLLRLCRQFDRRIHLILTPKFEFGYESLEAISRLKDKTEFDPDVPDLGSRSRILLLMFPRTERHNILQQAVWAHEIAHIVEYDLAQKLDLSKSIDSAQFKSLTDYFYAKIPRAQIDKSTQSVKEIFGKRYEHYDEEDLSTKVKTWFIGVLRNWITEIVCDLLSIRIFGPAALFAFVTTIEPYYNLSRPTPSHPPPIMRAKIMAEELKNLGLLSLKDSASSSKWNKIYGPAIREEVNRILKLSQESKTEIVEYNIVRELISSHLELIKSEIRHLDEPYFFKPSGMVNKFSHLMERLERDIPPNNPSTTDIQEVTTLPYILNAGWACWLVYCAKSYSTNAVNEDGFHKNLVREYEKINKLLLKAVEATEIQTQFIERKQMSDWLHNIESAYDVP